MVRVMVMAGENKGEDRTRLSRSPAVDQQGGAGFGEGGHELIHDAAGDVHEVVVGPLAPERTPGGWHNITT